VVWPPAYPADVAPGILAIYPISIKQRHPDGIASSTFTKTGCPHHSARPAGQQSGRRTSVQLQGVPAVCIISAARPAERPARDLRTRRPHTTGAHAHRIPVSIGSADETGREVLRFCSSTRRDATMQPSLPGCYLHPVLPGSSTPCARARTSRSRPPEQKPCPSALVHTGQPRLRCSVAFSILRFRFLKSRVLDVACPERA